MSEFDAIDDALNVESSIVKSEKPGPIKRPEELADLQKKLKDLEEDNSKSGPNSVTNNAVFVGSTTELQKLLKQGFLNSNSPNSNKDEKV